MGKQARTGSKVKWQMRIVFYNAVSAGGFLIDNETTTDRVIGALPDNIPCTVHGIKCHAVRVVGQDLVLVKHQVLLHIEDQPRVTRQLQLAECLYPFKAGRNRPGINRFRMLTLQSQDQRLVGTMPLAGSAQRTKQLDTHACKLTHLATIRQSIHKHTCSTHRSNGMRA